MYRLFLLVTLTAMTATMGLHAKRKLNVNTETPEGAKLKHLGDEADAAKKLALMEAFVKEHPSHDSTSWVYGEMQTAYLAANAFDKSLAAGEKVLADDADDVAAAHTCLKAAEGKKDAALIKKYAGITSAAARKAAAVAKPADADDVAAWTQAVDYAKQVDTYTEYSLYANAVQASSPDARIELGEALMAQNPNSQYVGMIRPQIFLAYQQKGNTAKAVEAAESGIKADPANDDMLLYLASKAYETKNTAKAVEYAKKIAEVLPGKPVPQGMAEADWNKNKSIKLGVAQWMLGVIASNEQKWADADTYLRAALPNVAGGSLAAETLFHLALANYRIGDPKKDRKRIDEALKYNQQCAAIASPFQAQARKNIAAIKSAYRIP
jgi:tetratricopeptide (TPR) repeat protein